MIHSSVSQQFVRFTPAFSCPLPRRRLTSEGDLLAPVPRPVADHGDMEMRTGSPSISRWNCPQLQAECRMVMARLLGC